MEFKVNRGSKNPFENMPAEKIEAMKVLMDWKGKETLTERFQGSIIHYCLFEMRDGIDQQELEKVVSACMKNALEYVHAVCGPLPTDGKPPEPTP